MCTCIYIYIYLFIYYKHVALGFETLHLTSCELKFREPTVRPPTHVCSKMPDFEFE